MENLKRLKFPLIEKQKVDSNLLKFYLYMTVSLVACMGNEDVGIPWSAKRTPSGRWGVTENPSGEQSQTEKVINSRRFD